MTSSMHWDHSIAGSRDDEAQLKRDMRHHPRTTGKSLRELARMTATQGSLHVTHSLDYGYAWLAENRDKLPREVEDDNGTRPSSKRLEISDSAAYDDAVEIDLESGLYDVSGHVCYLPLGQVAARNARHARMYAEFGIVHHVYVELMAARGKLLREYLHTEGRRRVLLANPERYGMDAIEKRKIRRTPTVSTSVSIPDNVAELLSYDGELRWKVARGTKAAGAVCEAARPRIGGVLYYRNRIIYRLVHGVDAGPLNVSEDGLSASRYRDNVKVGIHEQSDGTYDVRVDLPDSHRLAVCPTKDVAEGVQRGILWTINHL